MSTPSGASGQVARLLKLVPYLHGRDRVSLEQAARVLGVTPEQVVGDLKVLWMCGLPGGYPGDLIDVDLEALEEGGDGVLRVSNADYLARPLRLTETEAAALVVALRTLRAGAEPGTAEIVDRAVAKLEAAAAEVAVPALEVVARPGSVAEVRATLRAAIDRGRQVQLSYLVPTRDEVSERRVDPHRLVVVADIDYLEAWCHEAEAPRTFRLDRIHRATVAEHPIATTAPAAATASVGQFRPDPQALLVTLSLDRGAHWVPEYYPVEAVRKRRGGRLEVDLLVTDPRWLRQLVLRLAPDAQVLAPAELADECAAVAAAALRGYAEGELD